MTNHPNRSTAAGLRPEQCTIKVLAHTANSVEFECAGGRYLYMATHGRFYLNAAREVVHQSNNGSLCFADTATGGHIAAHAKLLGASIRKIAAD